MEENKVPVRKVNWLYRCIKRCFDIFNSFLAILLLSWLLIIILIVQFIYTKGHPIFHDVRIGKDFKTIKVLKFRTMYYDAETNIDKYLTPEQKEEWLRERKIDKDPRITPIGKVLRKTSLDELPQLFNILFGSMSFVGPRPMTEYEVVHGFNEEEQKTLLSVRPGLTGYWQVYGRSNVEFASGKRQALEMEYFSKRSLWMDLKILFLTIPAVLQGKGAK